MDRYLEIISISDCCGCEACTNICPQKCIALRPNSKGFLYPYVNTEKCIDCKLCERVCPVLNAKGKTIAEPLGVYAAKNPNEEIRMKSSSGGIFTMLAERTLNNGGVVFGVRFDENWDVIHDYIETIEGVEKFRGSKYVQSRIGDCFKKAKLFLDAGREVLFSGTPCQIAGLKRFLRKDYVNLLTVDIICHGVPSPLVFKHYIKSLEKKHGGTLTSFKFRDKANGWKAYEIVAEFGNGKEFRSLGKDNPFINGFIGNLFLRQSCTYCAFKNFKSGADITLGDFWGSERFGQEYNDNKGISLVSINTNKGLKTFGSVKLSIAGLIESSLADAVEYNPCLATSVKMHRNQRKFYRQYKKKEFEPLVKELLCESRLRKLLHETVPYYSGIIMDKIKNKLCHR